MDVVVVKVEANVGAGIVLVIHEGNIALLVNVDDLEVLTGDDGLVHVVGGRGDILVLAGSEDVDTDHVDLGVTVLTGLGCRDLGNLAGEALDDDMGTLLQAT